ncbi:YncE family protein [Nocardia camponoti]|uniref:Conserved lipoprotein LppL n=1 Tax=Nocardia camponoti TaxID=1616106 RepID=A0A917Q962_9NOCA|nr:hypothetical protein [Nocardia camponoti]GGK36285.1 putative conserved lipoprotein LppL [Nocardia camponoti]
MRSRGLVVGALLSSVALLIVGCGDRDGSPDVPTRPAATAAVSPPTTTAPAGQVTPISASKAVLAEAATGTVAVLDTVGTTLTLLGKKELKLPSPGASLAQGAPGTILVPAPGKVITVDATTGSTKETPIDGDARSAAIRPDGSLIVGTAVGKVIEVNPDGTVARTVSGLVSADVIALTGTNISVLDRRQTAIVAISDDHLGLMLRAGDGAANAITDPFGRIIVSDPVGGELLVYTAGPLVLRQRFPVASSPYGLAYDPRSDTVWVSATESNEVVGFDLSTGIGVEVARFPTVRQPDAITVDSRTGELVVVSAVGDGVQRISTGRGPR